MQRPSGIGAFQFVVLASLRAAQLMRGCLPRIDGVHKHPVTAQLEVCLGKVMQDSTPALVVAGEGSLAVRPGISPEPVVSTS